LIKKIGILFLSGAICLATVGLALAMEYKEAPMLRVKVAAGELPPVEERLPEEPLVVEPVEKIGQYGGAWRMVHLGTSDIMQLVYRLTEGLVRYSYDFTKILPNIAKSWKWSKDTKSITFFLRKGIKWSDGDPFTADDFMFWYEDIILNDELTPVKPGWFSIGGELIKMEKIDDYTIKLNFVEPYTMILDVLAGYNICYAPKHYLKQFHPKYTPMDEIKKKMKKEGFDRWIDLFGSKYEHFNNPGCPQIDAWIPINEVDKPIQVLVRNPYYWKVDPQGNQLPYIDKIERTLVSSAETIVLKAIAGDIDCQWRRLVGVENYSLLMQNREKGNFHIVLCVPIGMNLGLTFLNYSHKDPVLKELFLDKRFRIALSISINRDEINQLFFKGLGDPAQPTPPPGTPWYEEEVAKMYTKYDPTRANKLLDEIGLKWDKNHEYRLRPDGKRLKFVNTVVIWPGTPYADIFEQVKRYWKKIGIEMVVKPVEVSLWVTRVRGCNFDIAGWNAWMGFGGKPPATPGMYVFPTFEQYWGPEWCRWILTNGKSGEEPPAEIKRLAEIRKEILSETSAKKQIALTKEAIRIHAENLWMIGGVREPLEHRLMVVKNNFRNVPDPFPAYSCNTYWSSQFFIEK